MTIGVNAIVVRDNKILLIKREDLKIWALPGGLVEEKESLKKAIIREVKEETNIDIKPLSITGIYVRTIPFLEDILFVYKCQYVGSNKKPSLESPEVNWFTRKKSLKITPAFVKTIIKDAFSISNNEEPPIRKMNRYELKIIVRFLKNRIRKLFPYHRNIS